MKNDGRSFSWMSGLLIIVVILVAGCGSSGDSTRSNLTGESYSGTTLRIDSVNPAEAAPGDTITIRGAGFGTSRSLRGSGLSYIMFHSTQDATAAEAVEYISWNDSEVVCVVPELLDEGQSSPVNYIVVLYRLVSGVVISSSSVGQPSNTLTVYYYPRVTGLSPSTLSCGDTLTVEGYYFGSERRSRDGGESYVSFTPTGGGTVKHADTYARWTDRSIECSIPNSLLENFDYVVSVDRVQGEIVYSSSNAPNLPQVIHVEGAAWSVPERIDDPEISPEGEFSDPLIVADGHGTAIALWMYVTGSFSRIYANRYISGQGWGTAVQVDNSDYEDWDPRIVMDDNGNAIVLWGQYDGSDRDLYVNRYVVEKGWGVPQNLTPEYPLVPENSSLAINSLMGSAIVIWWQSLLESGIIQKQLFSKTFNPAGGWGAATPFSEKYALGGHTAVAMDSNNNAMAVWNRAGLWARRCLAATGWWLPQRQVSEDPMARMPQVAVDSDGNAIAIWIVSEFNAVFGNRFILGTGPNTGWQSPEMLNNPAFYNILMPSLSMNASGDAALAFGHYLPTDFNKRHSIYVRRYAHETGWSEPEEVDGAFGNAWNPSLVIDGEGVITVVWPDSPGTGLSNICANRFHPDSGWGVPVIIDDDDTGAITPDVAAGENRVVYAVWRQFDGIYCSIKH